MKVAVQGVTGSFHEIARYETNQLPNEEGSLSQVLPVVGREWEYMFYVDLIYSDYDRYRMSLDAIRPLTIDLDILGEYEQGTRPDEKGEEKVKKEVRVGE